MRRLYIEDESISQNQMEFNFAKDNVEQINGDNVNPEIFDTVIEDALYNSQEVWEAIKSHDEIYCTTSLIPLFGAMGSHTLLNGMMYKAIEENVTGKKLFILNNYKSIQWYQLKEKLVKGCFDKNQLYCYGDGQKKFVLIDIDELIKNELL